MANQLHDVDIPHLVVSADVVDLADTTAVYDQVDCAAVILNVEPIPHILAVAVNRQRFVVASKNNPRFYRGKKKRLSKNKKGELKASPKLEKD